MEEQYDSNRFSPGLVNFEPTDQRNSLFKEDTTGVDSSGISSNGTAGCEETTNAAAISEEASSAMLAASLQALATHCAHLQFRLHQVLEAPSAHRDKLLGELAEFASKPIDFIGEVKVEPLIEGLDEPSRDSTSSHQGPLAPSRMLEHLKTQVADLERFVSYIQKNDLKSPNNSVNESSELLNDSSFNQHSKRINGHDIDLKPLDLKKINYDSDNDDPSTLPLHRRLWQSLACGRSRQHVRTTDDSDDSDYSETEATSKKPVQKQPSISHRSAADTCDEDTDSVLLMLETTVRAYISHSRSEGNPSSDALAYALAVALTHGMRKDRIYRYSKKPAPQTSRAVSLPVAAYSWTFLKIIYDTEGGPPSTEANASRLRASFGVPEPISEKSTSGIITLLLGAINRVIVEEHNEPMNTSRSNRSLSSSQFEDNVSVCIHSWNLFVQIGLVKPTDAAVTKTSLPLLIWIRAISNCRRLLKMTHHSWAPIRNAPERILRALSILDEILSGSNGLHSLHGAVVRRKSEGSKFRKKLLSQSVNIINTRSMWANEDVIIPGV